MHELNVCLTHLHNPILFSHEALSLIAEASVNVIQVTGIVFFQKWRKQSKISRKFFTSEQALKWKRKMEKSTPTDHMDQLRKNRK